MNTGKNHRKLTQLRNKRSEAAGHLVRTQKQQQEMQTFLPAISQAIIIQLADMIEGLNEEIEELEIGFSDGKVDQYVQKAFEFLYLCEIENNEVPF